MTTPDHEWEILVNTGLAAVRMAERGELVDGHCELVYGLRRAELLVAAREAGPDLTSRVHIAIDAYCERWGAKLR